MINLKQISLSWLIIGLFALAISGIFSIVLAVAWHPSVKSVELFATLFHRSLIAHVNLSITIWFLCFAFTLMSYQTSQRKIIMPYVDFYAKILMITAISLMTAASLAPDAIAVLCNYIPLLQHPLFYIALALVAASIMLKLLEFFCCYATIKPRDIMSHSNIIIAIILAIAMVAFGVSGWQLQHELIFAEDVLIYGEMLFWGGGHIIQYAWVQLMLIAWVLMLQHCLQDFSATTGMRIIFYSNLLAVLTSPIPYILHPVTSGDFRELFTWLMAWLSGIAPVLFAIYYTILRIKSGQKLMPRYDCMISASLWWSVLLFTLGGAFAVMINGINVKIPAHYHGSLLGITVALMGLTYLLFQTHYNDYGSLLLPSGKSKKNKLGLNKLGLNKIGFWQPALLGVGQVMHIGGLFWSGGYGVQRKSPNQGGEAMELADLALRIQSSGGGIAIIGGLLFLVVCYKIWRNRVKN